MCTAYVCGVRISDLWFLVCRFFVVPCGIEAHHNFPFVVNYIFAICI